MARRSIKISSPDGTNTVTLNAEALKLPDPFPELQYENMNKSYQMRRTAVGPGRRVWKSVGTDINHANIEFIAHSLSSAEVTKLKTMLSAVPNVVLFSLDSGTTRYFAIFRDEGITFEGYENNEDPVSGTAFFIKATIKLALTESATQNFVS